MPPRSSMPPAASKHPALNATVFSDNSQQKRSLLMRTRWLALAAVTLSTWLVVRALAGDGAALPEPVFAKLVDGDAAFLKKALAKGKLTDKVERKVKAVALMIAAYAQS